MKLTSLLPLLLLQTTAHASILNRGRLPTVGEDLAAPTVALKRPSLDPEGLAAPTAILKRAKKAADPDPEEQVRPDDTRTKVVKRARPAPTLVGKRARKYADPDPEEQMGPVDPDSTRTRVAKRAKPAPTVAKRARKYADPDPEEQRGPVDPDSTRTRIAKRAKPAPTVVGKRATVDHEDASFRIMTLPTGRIEVPVHTHTPISPADINARPAGVQNSIGLNLQTLCSAFIPFTNAGTGTDQFPDNSGPRVYIDVDGVNIWGNSPKGLIVDTGSTGFTIGEKTWTNYFGKNWATTDKSRPGWKYLSSSNLLYKGYWVNVNITFKDLSWKPLIRSEVPVLVFDQKLECDEINNATGNCLVTPTAKVAEGAYMGIGYGRRSDGMTQCTPDTNPLLNVRGIWRDLPTTICNYRNGYVVTKTGIYWGLTIINTNFFKFHTLTKDSTVNMDWSMPTMCLKASTGAQTCRAGSFLPDTGLTKSYIASPDTPSGTAPPLNGFSIQLNIPNSGQGMGFLNYNNVGTGGSHLPSSYSAWKDGTRVYMNTGSRFYNAYEAAFDADSGYFGIKKV
ncbi:hypothetical protein TWF506_002588 [Arthrobotrys conoides]|uniref:Uncharacterized protein n=1 Tax=Arthrobotrys conoides TaxID=74498 RepID=A0AAN8ND98_9PEZI